MSTKLNLCRHVIFSQKGRFIANFVDKVLVDDSTSMNQYAGSHLYVKSCYKTEPQNIFFSQNGVGRGYLVAVTGSSQQLWRSMWLLGVYVAFTGRLPHTPCNSRDVP